jgi:hypothetical protein
MVMLRHSKRVNKVSGYRAEGQQADPPPARRPRPSEVSRPKKRGRVFWSGAEMLDGEQLILRVSEGTRHFNYRRSNQVAPGPRCWEIRVTHHVNTSDADSQCRSVRLSMSAFPIVSAVIAETASPAILADWIEDHPAAVLKVKAKRSRWRRTEFRCGRGYGRPVEDNLAESDDEAIAGLVKSLRIGWTGSFFD